MNDSWGREESDGTFRLAPRGQLSLQRSGYEQCALPGPPAPGSIRNVCSRLLPPQRFAGIEERLQFRY